MGSVSMLEGIMGSSIERWKLLEGDREPEISGCDEEAVKKLVLHLVTNLPKADMLTLMGEIYDEVPMRNFEPQQAETLNVGEHCRSLVVSIIMDQLAMLWIDSSDPYYSGWGY